MDPQGGWATLTEEAKRRRQEEREALAILRAKYEKENRNFRKWYAELGLKCLRQTEQGIA